MGAESLKRTTLSSPIFGARQDEIACLELPADSEPAGPLLGPVSRSNPIRGFRRTVHRRAQIDDLLMDWVAKSPAQARSRSHRKDLRQAPNLA